MECFELLCDVMHQCSVEVSLPEKNICCVFVEYELLQDFMRYKCPPPLLPGGPYPMVQYISLFLLDRNPPPANRLTENMTFPRPTCADGNKKFPRKKTL